MADIDDRPRSARGTRPFEDTDELAPRKTRPRTIAIYAALGLGAVWAIVAGIDQAEKAQTWGWDPGRPILPERKIDWPKVPGLFALDKGRTIPLGGASPAPELSPRAEFLFSDAAVAQGLYALPIRRITIETDGANATSASDEESSIAHFLHQLNEGSTEARRFPEVPDGSALVQTLAARPKKHAEMLRLVPEEELSPGLYRIADFAHFYVDRKAVHEKSAAAAGEALKSKDWARAVSRARAAAELKPGDPEMEAMLAAIPAQALAEARAAVQRGDWEHAVAHAKFVSSWPGSDGPAKTSALEVLRQALFEEREDEIVLDRATGLMWTKQEWAQDAAPDIDRRLGARFSEIKVGGYTDWRTPALSELAHLYERFALLIPETDRRPPPLHWGGSASEPAWSMEGQAFDFRTGREIPSHTTGRGTIRGVRMAALDPMTKIENVPALHPAVTYGYFGLASALLQAGADPNTKLNGIPVLNMAVENGDEAFVRLLVEKGASVSAPSDEGRTPLEAALLRRDIPIASLLLQKGAEPAMLQGLPDLLWTVHEGQNDLLEILLKEGRDANLRGPKGRTALMVAAERQRPDSAELLIAHGADLEIADEAGRKAWEFVPRSPRADDLRKLLGAPAPKKDKPVAKPNRPKPTTQSAEANSDESQPREASSEPAIAEAGSEADQPSEPMASDEKPRPSSSPESANRTGKKTPVEKDSQREPTGDENRGRSSPRPSSPAVKTPAPGPSEAERRRQSEQAQLKRELDASRRRADSARRSARSSKLGALNDLALLPFDQLLEDSRRLEAAGDLRGAIGRAKEAETGYKTIKGALNLPFVR